MDRHNLDSDRRDPFRVMKIQLLKIILTFFVHFVCARLQGNKVKALSSSFN